MVSDVTKLAKRMTSTTEPPISSSHISFLLDQVWSNFMFFPLVRVRTLLSNGKSTIQHKIWNTFWRLSYNISERLSFINDVSFMNNSFSNLEKQVASDLTETRSIVLEILKKISFLTVQ